METGITIAIYIHALFGAVGLISGSISFASRKGSEIHKLAGKWFAIGMLTSSGISLPVACMPGHENPFLFMVGLFTIYMVLVGTRALRFKNTAVSVSITDWSISVSILIVSLVMLVLGGFYFKEISVLYLYFGILGVLLCITDYRFLRNPRKTKKTWLVQHIGKIMGAFIASITAFLVAGMKIPGILVWIVPGILGGFAIRYWIRKVKRGAKVKSKTDRILN